MVTSGLLSHVPFPPPQPMELRLKGRVGLTCCTHVWEEARDTLWHLIKIGLNKDKNKDKAASASHIVGQLYDIIPMVQVELSGPGVCVMAEGLQICRRDRRSNQELAVELSGPVDPQSGWGK